jgi:hypothetical protein
MAVKDKKEPAKVEPIKVEPAKAEPTKTDTPATATERASLADLGPWIAAIYAAGLLLVFCGERIVSTIDEARYALTGLGVAAMVITTGMRFAAAGRFQGERRKVEQSLAKYSLGGLVALAIYFLTTDTGKGLLGIDTAAPATRARFESAATVAWVVLLLVSLVPLLFGERALFPMRRAEQIEGRRVQTATVSALTLVFAATYAALFTYSAGELDVKADFSYFRTARPSESTRNVAQGLTQPVKVTAFFPQLSEVGTEVEGYLRDLGGSSSSLEIEVQDRLLVPALAKEAKVTQDGVIVLTRGTSRESLTIGAEMKTAQAKLKSLDVDFQKALLKLMREQRTAYFTTGHGELNEASTAAEGRSSKGFKKLLETQNYAVKDLGLAQGSANDIPADAGLLIVLGPSRPLLDEEIAAIRRYAERGGKILMALDPDAKVDFNALAEAVDLTWKPAILAADKNFVPRRRNPSDHMNLVTNTFSSHASVSTLSKVGRAPVIFAGAAGLDKKAGTDAKVDFAVRALAETFADDNGNFEFDKATEKRSAFNLAAAVSRPVPGAPDSGKDKQPPEMRAFVMGDVDALSDAIIGVPPALVHEPNALLALDVMRWLGGEESFSGALNTTEDVRIEHTKQKDKLWFYGTIFGAPALVLGGGLWLTRRKRRLSPAAARRAAPKADPKPAPRKGRSA